MKTATRTLLVLLIPSLLGCYGSEVRPARIQEAKTGLRARYGWFRGFDIVDDSNNGTTIAGTYSRDDDGTKTFTLNATRNQDASTSNASVTPMLSVITEQLQVALTNNMNMRETFLKWNDRVLQSVDSAIATIAPLVAHYKELKAQQPDDPGIAGALDGLLKLNGDLETMKGAAALLPK